MNKESLVIDNLKLIYFVMKKMKLYGDLNEYYEVGLIGLVKASKKYNPSTGYNFGTFAYRCIFNEIRNYIRMSELGTNKANKNTISLETVIYNKGSEEIILKDTLKSEINLEKELLKKEQIKMLYNSISKLKERDKFVINHYYGLNNYKKLKQKDIAIILGINQSRVSKIVELSKKRLRKMMEDIC